MEVNVSDTCLEEKLDLSENAIKVLERRYLKRDKDGNCTETPADMFRKKLRTIQKLIRLIWR